MYMNNEEQCKKFIRNKNRKIKQVSENKINKMGQNEIEDFKKESIFSSVFNDIKHLFSPLKEGMDTQDSNDILMSDYNSHISEIENLGDQFKTTLQDYQNEYTTYLSNLESQEDSIEEINKNKIISVIQKNPNGTDTTNTLHYYINNLGVKRLFPDGVSYKQCDNTLQRQGGEPVPVLSSDADKLVSGSNMNPNEKCSWGAGYNVKTKDSKNVYWVDMLGRKNMYKTNIKDPSCPSESRILTQEQLNTIPTGSGMSYDDKCEYINLHSTQWGKVKDLNNKLMGIVEQIKQKNDELVQIKNKLGISNDNAEKSLNLVNVELTQKKKILYRLTSEMDSIRANLNNRKLDTTSLQYKNVLFGLSTIIILFLILKHFN